jgi:uncharacterized protein
LEIDPRFGYLYCSAFAKSTYVIDPKGKLYKCAGLQGRKENQFGEVGTHGEIMNFDAERYNAWIDRNPLKFPKCKKCKMLPICGGGCAGTVFTKYGTYTKNDCFDKTEELTKEKIELLVEFKRFPKCKGGLS